ncbi:hypothetical protein PAHAL_9G032400 [Panicum hallii]|uniref:DUF4378 domain-containing protein n=1 Tax=Panicum hallii TaxID=206008 RepID=A0A2S3IGP1_9POAL|nr:uncharacterized protein LOC112874801 isoform X2 [Panicum hallii]PAN44291.1 hypothetical protein PAHAL_9G032400 [Panicum hallii]PAN44293.1 hypothetical protein PAHAL_9G032400 [Panicum hallii]PAN44294.1 hypothetical protein PAHAL_9G032400 [Panicum hallii]
MGGPSDAGGRRRWARRSCRTGGGSGVVRRTVAAPAGGASTAPRRVAEGFAHVDKQRRVRGVLSDFRYSNGSTDHLSLDIGEFKHKSSYGGSARRLQSEINVTETSHMQPSVMAELDGFDAAGAVVADSQKTSIPWPRENKTSSNIELCHVGSMVSGLPIRHKYCLNNPSSSLKNPPTVKSCSHMSDFSNQLVRSAERSASAKMGLTSANSSLSEKMSLLRQPRYGGNHQNQNRISALNRRHKIVNSRGANDLLNTEKFHDRLDSSLGRHSQVLLNNALVREKQLCCSDLLNQKATEELWSSAYSESEKIVCFFSGDSIDDLQVSSSSDTSDSSNLSSLGVVANDQWKMTFKKVYCPHAARLDSTSVIYRKEVGQASPISVLEPPSEDCSDSENIRREPADLYETAAEASSIGRTSDYLFSEVESGNDVPMQLVEDILGDFEDEEERDFSYLLDILIASGIHGTAEDQLYKVCQSLDCPAGYDVFEKLENKFTKVVNWSRSERKLLFDMVNTVLSQILAPCLSMQPWVNTARNLAPLWGSEGLLEKVLQVLAQRQEELSPSDTKPEKKGFDQKWLDLADCIDRAGRDIEKMIKDDLLDELVLELLSV